MLCTKSIHNFFFFNYVNFVVKFVVNFFIEFFCNYFFVKIFNNYFIVKTFCNYVKYIFVNFLSKFLTIILSFKYFAIFTRILTFLLIFSLLFTQCLINYVTKLFVYLLLLFKVYFIIQNFYNIFKFFDKLLR